LVKTNNFLGITLLFNKSDILFSADKPIQSFQVFKNKLRENLMLNSNEAILFTSMKQRGIQEFENDFRENDIYLRDKLKQEVLKMLTSSDFLCGNA
jgi:hypothetical protein